MSPKKSNCIADTSVPASPIKQLNERSRQINAQTNALLFESIKVSPPVREQTPEERKPRRLKKCKPRRKHVSDSNLVVPIQRAAATSRFIKNVVVDNKKHTHDLKDTKLKKQKKRLKKHYKELKRISDQLEN